MKKLLLVTLLLAACNVTIAQNWQTVKLKDTVFYSVPSSPGSSHIDSNLLRSMWADSAMAIVGDSQYFFFRGIRLDTPYTICQDTLAPSWLGSHMIRKPDGTEYYFGRRGDTITFRTLAGLGEQWIIGRDVSGKEFQGTVSSLSLQMVDGVTDSVKTISIQALSGGAPVPDPYNAMVFQFSKNHGWLKTLDLYRFTDGRGPEVSAGLRMLPEQHQRLPYKFGIWNPGHVDLAWRYAVGSDFITIRQYGVPNISGSGKDPAPVNGGNEIITHDSVLAFTPLSPGFAEVTFRTTRYSHIWILKGSVPPPNGLTDTIFTSSYIHVDTVAGNNAAQEVRSYPLYESKYAPLPTALPTGFGRQYFMDTIGGVKYSLEELRATQPSALVKSGNCWKWSGISPDPEVRVSAWVEDFGMRLSFYYRASPTPVEYDRLEVTYANLPGLTWGKKINVATLDVSGFGAPQSCAITVYPNPANAAICISGSGYSQSLEATLRSISGQKVRQESFTSKLNMPTADLPPGLYFLEVSGKERREIFKVIVRH